MFYSGLQLFFSVIQNILCCTIKYDFFPQQNLKIFISKYNICSKLYVRIHISESWLSEKTVILKYILRIFYHLKCALSLDKPSSFGHDVRVKFHVMHRCAQVSRITSKQLNFSWIFHAIISTKGMAQYFICT